MRSCFPIRKRRSPTISRTTFVSVFWPGETARSIKWFRLPVRENRTIVEGSKASGTSKEAEIELTNVARTSLEELLIDYRDFLRVRDLRLWEKDSREAQFVRKLGNKPDVTYETFREFCETRPAEVVANIAICLIHQTNYLLEQQIRRLERDFVQEGGLRERMTHARLQYRNTSHPSHKSYPAAPDASS
jgi:four helix bundle suffix protein